MTGGNSGVCFTRGVAHSLWSHENGELPVGVKKKPGKVTHLREIQAKTAGDFLSLSQLIWAANTF